MKNLTLILRSCAVLAQICWINLIGWLCLVAERDSEIIGFCIGYVAPHFFGNDLTSGDLAIYVVPEHRGGMMGARLVKAYDAWCSEKASSNRC